MTDRFIRLTVKSTRGWPIVLKLPASLMEDCADWALEAREFDPAAEFRFEETNGRVIELVKPPLALEPMAPVAPSPAPAPVAPKQETSALAGLWALLRGRF